MILAKVIFGIATFVIFWANIGYPASILLLDKVLKKKKLPKNLEYEPSVTIMIVAHNEEKVIEEKLENVINLNYPKEKLEILVSSDNSTDQTNCIVNNFINRHKERKIVLYEVEHRKGKTNAQNEAAKLVKSEIMVMTDANAMLEKNAVKELVSAFYDDSIAYVTGRLCYINSTQSSTSKSENTYWDLDTRIRDIESKFQTITAGNGALYACRTKEYHEFKPIECHDSAMPLYYALKQKKAIANHDAIAYEKAGENMQDEFKRKVRMNRIILSAILPDIEILNIFKFKWFTYFYFGHRTCRYLLGIMHIALLISNAFLVKQSILYLLVFIAQIIIYLLAIFKQLFNLKSKLLDIIYYYCMTMVAQIVGIKNILTGKAKPFWEKAESTR